MTNAELIQAIRNEIERQMDEYKPSVGGIDETTGAHIALAKLLSFISTLESEKPIIPNDLEEAAEKEYPCDKSCMTPDMLDLNAHKQVAFRKGAKWQYQKDRGKFAQIKAKTWCEGFDACKEQMPLPEDTVLFNKGVEEGKRLAEEELSDLLTIAHLQGADQMKEQILKDGNVILTEEDFDAEKEKSMEWGYNLCKEQMLKDAVECYYGYVNNCTKVFLPEEALKGIKEGYVKIVILKNDE